MTERKPPDMSFTSWIDQQINEAAERGAFDDLPGAGKPLPRWPDNDGAQAWLRDYLRREGISSEELLPTPLRLRKQIERLTQTVQDLRSEQEVRDVAADLNRQIIQWRRIPEGPPIPLRLVDADQLVSRWRAARAAAPPVAPPAQSPADPGPAPAHARPPRPPRWWRRLRQRAQGRPGNSPSAGLPGRALLYLEDHVPLARRCRGIRKLGSSPLVRADRSWLGSFGGGRLVVGSVEGAQLCWRAVRRQRQAMDCSRPLFRLLPESRVG